MKTFNIRDGSPILKTSCPVCKEGFRIGDECVLIPIVPADREEAVKAREGREYTSQAAVVHYECRWTNE